MIYFYLFCFLGSFIFLLWGAVTGVTRTITQAIAIAIVIISNGGYFALATSQNLSEAILANKLMYISGCFLPLMFFIIICELCKLNPPSVLVFVLYFLQTILYLFVCSIGFTTWYYKDAVFYQYNGVGYLVKEYGPMHIFYPLTMYGYILASLFVLIVSLKRGTKVSRRNCFFVLSGFFLSGILFTAERMLNIKLELMPIVNTLILVFILPSISNINKFNIQNNSVAYEEYMRGIGYVVFDKNFNFMGCNKMALDIFPELSGYSVDSPIPIDGSAFRDIIVKDVKKYIFDQDLNRDDMNFANGDRHYDYIIEDLRNNNKKDGYLVTIHDVTERYNHVSTIENYNRNLESEVRGKTHKIREIQEKTVLGMAEMVESRDLSTGGHIKRTSLVIGIFAKALLEAKIGLDEDFLYYVERSAPMHDLGKIAVDDQILRKQGKFTDEEYAVMKKHSAAGAKIVRNILTGIEDDKFVRIATNVAHYHHEKVNGKGYPEGLCGEDIPIEARIMALADVFDALVSKRCYKEAFTFDRAFDIIREDSGSHFDAALAEIFIGCRPELESLYNSFVEE